MNKYMTQQLKALREMKANQMKSEMGDEAMGAPTTPAQIPTSILSENDKKNKPQKWAEYIIPGVQAATTIGAGIADIFAEGDDYPSGGSVPGGSSPRGVDTPAVSQPFSGRMQLSPQQRQSLALALLNKAGG